MIIKKKIQKSDAVEEDVKVEETAETTEVSDAENQEEDKPVESVDEIDLFDLDNIDFKQRHERRRGDRRRGFRRIDDRNLISRAREEAQSIKESAVKEGYEEGINQAKADIENLRNSLNAFVSAKQEVFDYIAPDILEISVDIAKKIIKKEIQQDPTIILENIVDLLKSLSKEETRVTLSVDNEDVLAIYEKITYGRTSSHLNKYLESTTLTPEDFTNTEKFYYALFSESGFDEKIEEEAENSDSLYLYDLKTIVNYKK